MARFSLSALGADRPGIVAGVSRSLVDLGCNLEDSTMTILHGHFAILLVVSAPGDVTEQALLAALDPVAQTFDLTVAVRPMAEDSVPSERQAPGEVESEAWTISVHGADRPGIVHAVTSALAEAGGNVVDLSTHLVGEREQPVYVMTMRATLPSGKAGEAAAEGVRRAAAALDVHCTVHRDESDVF